MSWAIEREYIPKIGGNDTAPDDEQIRIYFKPFKVGEKGEFAADVMRLGTAVMKSSPKAAALRERLASITPDDDEAVESIFADSAELLKESTDAEQDMLMMAFKRVVRGCRGTERVDGWRGVWDAVSDDEELTSDIAFAIINSAGVSKNQRPF
ncbi:hypothetical protein HN371_08565 [Candidatus Poribacteria bacterium]|nr:hypothetical protein [Candidatus Poribacteria bacterium]MBT7098070.1 hypothetical protein [Candidatus Poribacteria bacterium]